VTLDETGSAADRLGRFLDVTRHVKLAIGGEDLLALGFDASPAMGEVLRSVLHLRLNGVVRSRDDELAAATRLRG
jgi:hypothetical protein